MKKAYCIPLALVASLVFLSAPARAQDESHVFLVTTWETLMPEGGSAAERNAIISQWTDEVTANNEYIVSQTHLRHLYGSDSGQWIVITEFRNWNDIEAADPRDTELFLAHWTTPEEQEEFNSTFGKYFGGHSDEIYSELSQFNK